MAYRVTEKGAVQEQGGDLLYPFPDYPGERNVVEVAEGVYWVSTPVPFPGLRQVNLCLLRDGAGWTMVDCGYGDAEVQDFLAELWDKVLEGQSIRRLVITHFHPDHAGNSGWISQRWGGLKPLMTQGEWFAANLAVLNQYTDNVAQRAVFYEKHGLDQAHLRLFAEGVVLYSAGVRLPPAYQRIREDDVLLINGDRWRILIGEGHSPEHASLYCAERQILISGDQVLPTITTNISTWPTEPGGDPLDLFLKTCRRFADILDPRSLVLPSHRKPFRNVHHRLRELAVHHAHRLDLILQTVSSETTAAELIDVLFPRQLDGHQIGFAMGEAIGHLNHLVTLGRMDRIHDGSGKYRYRKRRGGDDTPVSFALPV